MVSLPTVPADAASTVTIPEGTVQAIAEPGASLAVPADGRIDGYGFAGQVLGVATGSSDPGAGLRAAGGDRLWVFGVRFVADVNQPSDTQVVTVTPTAVLSYGGQRVSVPLAQPPVPSDTTSPPPTVDSGDEYFAASVPAGTADVVLEMANGGFAQDFSLSHMAREGVSPVALYRSRGAWHSTDDVAGTQVLPTPYVNSDFDLPGASLTVGLDTATLSYFGPDGTTDLAPGPGQAWLVPDLSDPFNPNNGISTQTLEYLTSTTAADLTLSLPGGPVIHPKALPGGPDPPGGTGDGSNDLFPDLYAFAVPATLTTATLAVHVPPEQVTPAFSGEAETTLKVGTAVFHISFPPLSAPVPPAGAASTPAVISSGQAGGIGSGGSGFPLVWLIAAVVIVLAGGGGAVAVRRRGRRPAAPKPDVGTHEDTLDPAAAAGEATPPGRDSSRPDGTKPAATVDGDPHGRSTPTMSESSGPPAASPGAAILVPIPSEPPWPAEGQPRVLVLGGVELSGWPGTAAPGQTELELLVFLALHPERKFTAEQLANILSRSRRNELGVDTVRRYIRELRRVLGDRLPEARRGEGYQLVGVLSDAGLFDELAHLAAQTGDLSEQAAHLAGALSVVRGFPFADSPTGSFGWANVADVDDNLAAGLANRILAAAYQLADLALSAGDAGLAEWAVAVGSRVLPGDDELDLRALSAADLARPSRLEQVWLAIDSRVVMGDKVEPSARVRDHYTSLRRKARATPAS